MNTQVLYKSYYENPNLVKCGEIYYDENQKIIFQCLLCDLTAAAKYSPNIVEHFAAHLSTTSAIFKQEKMNECKADYNLEENFTDEQQWNNGSTSDTSIEDDAENSIIKDEYIPAEHETKINQHLKNLSNSPTCVEVSSADQVRLPVVEPSIEDNMYHCPFQDCGKTKETLELIKIHMRNIHVLEHQVQGDGRYQCPVCDSSFRRRDNLLLHAQNIHKLLSGISIEPSPIDSKFHCPVCDLTRGKLHMINTHLRVQHEEYFNELLEEQQNKLIPVKKRRRGHSKVCEICGKVLSSSSLLQDHIAMHTGAKPHKCNYCEKSFTSRSVWRGHMLIHTKEKSYKCNYCDKKFIRSAEKIKHEVINHIKEKPFKCGICDKQFYSNYLLKNHHLRHTGERPYTCDICLKSYFDGTTLKDHMLTHSDTKDYECDICHSKFSRKKNLATHKQTHSSIKKFNCEKCGQRFAQYAGLYSHKKTHHKELLKAMKFEMESEDLK